MSIKLLLWCSIHLRYKYKQIFHFKLKPLWATNTFNLCIGYLCICVQIAWHFFMFLSSIKSAYQNKFTVNSFSEYTLENYKWMLILQVWMFILLKPLWLRQTWVPFRNEFLIRVLWRYRKSFRECSSCRVPLKALQLVAVATLM